MATKGKFRRLLDRENGLRPLLFIIWFWSAVFILSAGLAFLMAALGHPPPGF